MGLNKKLEGLYDASGSGTLARWSFLIIESKSHDARSSFMSWMPCKPTSLQDALHYHRVWKYCDQKHNAVYGEYVTRAKHKPGLGL